MTELFITPINKFTTATLKTLPLAKLKFYEAGTTTPKAVYADKYKNVSLGSIVTADSAGNFLPIYLDGLYRVELTNSAETITQPGWPVDNIGGSIEMPFDEWSPGATYEYGALVVETIEGVGTYKYESTFDDNNNFRPSENPDKWKRIYFNSVITAASGSAVSNSGLTAATITILNGQQFRIELDDEKSTGIMNIQSNVNSSAFREACFFVSPLGTIVSLANSSGVYVIGSSPAATKIGVYNDGNRSLYIKNNTGFTIVSTINILGPGIQQIEDNA